MQDEEAVLVACSREGDPAAFEALVRTFQGRLRAFFATRLSDTSMVDDLAQETFFIAHRRLSSFDPSLPFYPWLRGIALNVFLNEVRKQRPQGQDPWSLNTTLDSLATEQADLISERAGTDVVQALKDCLAGLGTAATRMIQERYQSDLPLEAIARREGKSAKTLSVILVRIRQQLRECLAGRGFGRAAVQEGA